MAISPQNNVKTVFYTGKLYGFTGMYLCFVFMLWQAHFNWVSQGRLRWSSLLLVLVIRVDLFKNHVQQNLLDVPGIVDEDHGRGTHSNVWEMARWSLVLFRASYVSRWLGLLNATIQAINAKMGYKHFFKRVAVLFLLMFWWIRSTPPIVLLWCLIWNGWPPFSHHLNHHLIFWTEYMTHSQNVICEVWHKRE